MEIKDIKCPKFAWILMIALGCVDLIRGFMHTFLLEYAALNIFVIDLSGGVDNQIFLLGIFGISNYLTGIVFILIGLSARHLVPIILPVIPFTYFGGAALIARVANPTADLGGNSFMLVYFLVCIAAFFAILVIKVKNRMKNKIKNKKF
ncbi:MAG: hypothetical protein MUP85_08815 [Candidatus Lokiarchaeota archaeon]|nr:hypothetical protein [Candidatus Lokiarchaeota archaeon]